MQKFLLIFCLLFATLEGLDLKSFYRIEGDLLINAQGKAFPAIAFGSELHEELAFRLKDPEQAELIHEAYVKYIQPTLSYEPSELVPAFQRALLKVCYLFGSQNFSPENGLLLALQEENCASWVALHQEAFNLFLQESNRSAHRVPVSQKGDPFTIVILTTSASGGNESVTRGIEHFLSAYPNTRTIVIDTETVAKETDLIMLATGQTTYDGLYASVCQQANNLDILIERDVLSKEIGRYVPSRFGSVLKQKILEVNPDLILSTRSYTPDDIPLATLGIPFRMIHCDYEVSFFLLDLYGKINSDAIRFWLPTFQPRVFKPLFLRANRLDLYREEDSQDILMQKIAFLTGIKEDACRSQWEVIGFPTRHEFHKIETSETLATIRREWDIRPEETPILISMGKNGVGTLEEIFEQLVELPARQWKFLFVCGKNQELKDKLEARLTTLDVPNRVAIYGFLSPEQMNALMNVSTLKITKPGGAIVSESMVTGTYLLLMHSHPWEEANGAKIEQMGLGQRYNPDSSFLLQIETCLNQAQESRARAQHEVDWKASLLEELSILAAKVGKSLSE